MTEIIENIKKLAVEINYAIKTKDTGKAQTQNSSGDIQVKLDVISDKIVR